MQEIPHHSTILPDYGDFSVKIARRLQVIYRSSFNEGMVNRIMAIANKHYPSQPKWDEKDILLITYGNTIIERQEVPLQTLHKFLLDKLQNTISCVHVLPFFPYTSDDGFAVSDFKNVDPELGTWDDIAAITADFCLMADLVINHVSSAHPWVKNFLSNVYPGREFFIERQPGADYAAVVRPRSSPLFTRFESVKGHREIWTTFGPDQVDLNFSNPEVLFEMLGVMAFYISRGVRFIRLDAIAYLWKHPGTPCVHLGETHEIVKLLRDVAEFICPGTIIITETNVPNKENWSYFGKGDEAHMVYQFSLPPLLLHAFFSEDSTIITHWAREIPDTLPDQTFLNYTASHDGIGVRPLEGILSDTEIDALIDGMKNFGGLVSMKANKDGTTSPYEINITWFDAMIGTQKGGKDSLHEARFLCSQAIMMSFKGIPAFYIHSLLATPNDKAGVEKTGRARSINRGRLKRDSLYAALSADTMQSRIHHELVRMIGIRRQCAAFHPDSSQMIVDLGDQLFAFSRFNETVGEKIYCISNISSENVILNTSTLKMPEGYDLLSDKYLTPADPILVKACQTLWIVIKDH